MFDDTLLKVVFSWLPNPFIAAIAATAMSAAIRPYSIAVAPRVRRNINIKVLSMFFGPGKKKGDETRVSPPPFEAFEKAA
jgi:hypothetical protein